MMDCKADSFLLQAIVDGFELLKLLTSIVDGWGIVFISTGEVGEDTVTAQIRERTCCFDFLNSLFHVAAIETDTSHAAVYLNVALNGNILFLCFFLQLSCIIHGIYCLGDVVLTELFCLSCRGHSQHENRMEDPLSTQGHRFIDIRYRKPVHAQFDQFVGNEFIAVSVGIGFDYRHDHTARPQFFSDLFHVVGYVVQIDHCPASSQIVDHSDPLLTRCNSCFYDTAKTKV